MLRFATPENAEKAYDRIAALEPDKHYRWAEAQADGTLVNVLFGKSPRKRSIPCEHDEWDGWDDPLFKSALEVIEETLQSEKEFAWDLKPLFRLQMAYLLLWSAIERYASLRYHFGNKVEKKVKHLAHEPAFRAGLEQFVSERREVYRADSPTEREVLNPQSPEEALRYYYQIRCNIIHRGKGVIRDHERVLKSLDELLSIFRGVLKTARADARAEAGT